MATIKEKTLNEFPHLTELIVSRLDAHGRKGFCKINNYLQIWDENTLLCEASSTKKAYSVARKKMLQKAKKF